MQISDSKIKDLVTMIVTGVIEALEKGNYIDTKSKHKTAYQKTEQLLYNYNGFKRIIKEKELEIETLRTYGVPKKSTSIVEYSSKSGTVQGMVTEEESVESAIRNVQASVQGTVQAITLIDNCMAALKHDPYYSILEMRYFEGRTQEDIAVTLGCSQVTVSKNKSRLIKELAMRLFPDQAIAEMMH
jgi:RNA polymerase sigma factor (sigma-70 family)